MKRILKWDVPVDGLDHEIGGGHVVHVACQLDKYDVVQVWTEEYKAGDEPVSGYLPPSMRQGKSRTVRVVGTGHHYDGTALGSVVVADGQLVWHVVDVS